MAKENLGSESLKVMKSVMNSVFVFLFFLIFFVNGYVLHGTFIGFRPLDLSQFLISITIGFFVAIPILGSTFTTSSVVFLIREFQDRIEKEDKSEIEASKKIERAVNLTYLTFTGAYIYFYDTVVLFCWFAFTNMEPILKNPLILFLLLCLYVLIVVISVGSAVHAHNKQYKKWKANYEEMKGKKQELQLN